MSETKTAEDVVAHIYGQGYRTAIQDAVWLIEQCRSEGRSATNALLFVERKLRALLKDGEG